MLAALAFFLLAILADRYKRSTTSLEHVRDELQSDIRKKQAAVNQLWLDSNLLKSAAREPFRDPAFSRLMELSVYLFGYGPGKQSSDQLLFWNNQQCLPYPSLLYEKKSSGFIKAGNGYYVWMRHRIKPFTYIAMIPVKWNYYVSNSYLDNHFAFNPKLGNRFSLGSDARSGLPVTDLNGSRLFNLYEVSFNGIKTGSSLAFVWLLIAIGCLLIYLQLLANWMARRWSAGRGWIFLLLSVTVVRFLTYRFDAPLYLRRFALFDPAIYSTNPVFRSLGDLLINVLLITWLILFARQLWFKQSLSFPRQRPIPIWIRWIMGALLLGIPTFALAGLIRSLVSDSQISFDVLNFFTLSAYSVIGFAVLCAIGIAYYFWCQFIIEQWRPWIQERPYFFWLTVALLGLIYLSIRIGKIHGGFDVYILGWLLLFLILLNSRLFDWLKNRLIASRLVFWVFFFSVSFTGLLIRENNLKEKSRRIHYAEMLAQNSTRTDFIQRLQKVIDAYNSGATSTENYYDELTAYAQELKEEAERHIREGLTEDELELFDLLKKETLTQDETQRVKLAAKHLLKRLVEEQPKVLIQNWHQSAQTQKQVRAEIERVLDADLPESYDRTTFKQKCDNVFDLVVDYASRGRKWAA